MFIEDSSLTQARALMVQEQLAARNIRDPRVLEAMNRIPRHLFVDKKLWDSAYIDGPLPIGYGQTISQPYMVAFMTQALQLPLDGQAVVLEIGTGSGYQTAILSQLVTKVYTIERIETLAQRAQHCLNLLDINNVEMKVADGGYGWPEHAPYDGIIATAAAPEMPAPLIVQLQDGARLIAPIGPKRKQQLIELQREGNKIKQRTLIPVAFVPLIGEHGWEEDEDYA